jgi:hypothetical protein
LRNLVQVKAIQAAAAATTARLGAGEAAVRTALADLAALVFPLKAV